MNRLATIALSIGLLGVALAAFQNNFIHKDRQAPRPMKDIAIDAAKELIEDKFLHKDAPARVEEHQFPLHPYQMVYVSLGIVALGLGVYSWTRKAHIRLSGAAVALGLIAMCWHWVGIAVAFAVVIFILSMLG